LLTWRPTSGQQGTPAATKSTLSASSGFGGGFGGGFGSQNQTPNTPSPLEDSSNSSGVPPEQAKSGRRGRNKRND